MGAYRNDHKLFLGELANPQIEYTPGTWIEGMIYWRLAAPSFFVQYKDLWHGSKAQVNLSISRRSFKCLSGMVPQKSPKLLRSSGWSCPSRCHLTRNEGAIPCTLGEAFAPFLHFMEVLSRTKNQLGQLWSTIQQSQSLKSWYLVATVGKIGGARGSSLKKGAYNKIRKESRIFPSSLSVSLWWEESDGLARVMDNTNLSRCLKYNLFQ